MRVTLHLSGPKDLTRSFDCDPRLDLIRSLKELICLDFGIEPRFQSFQYRCVKMDDDKTLDDYNYVEGGVIEVDISKPVYLEIQGDMVMPLEYIHNETVGDLIKRVAKVCKVETHQVELFNWRRAKLIDNSRRVVDCDILPESERGILTLKLHAEDLITVYVADIRGYRLTLKISENGTIGDLKDLINASENIPREDIRLMFRARQVQDETVLKDAEIVNGSHLYAMPRFVGGG